MKIFKMRFLLSGFLVMSACGWAAADANIVPDPEAAIETAVVKLDGQSLFQVRGMAGFTAAKRAAAVESRIEAVADNPAVSTSAIVVNELPEHSDILAGDIVLVRLLDADAATEKIPRNIMAEAARQNTARAIQRYRHDRSPTVLMRRAILACVATLLFLMSLLALRRLFQRLHATAERHVKTRMESLEMRSSKAIEARPLWAAVVGALNLIRLLALAVVVYFYLNLVLGLFPWTRPVAASLFSIFINPLRVLAKGFIRAIPNIAFLAILYIVVRYVLKVTRLFFAAIDEGAIVIKNFEQDWAWPTYRIARLLVICFALVVAYPYIPGSSSEAFKGVSLFVGVLFSLGSTSFIANMIAGIALTYRRAFRVGDFVKIGDMVGVVTDMRLQTTHLRNRHNETIVIPNSVPLNAHVINYSALAKNEGLVLHTVVGVGYATPWRQVEAMLLQAAERTPGLINEPKAFVRQLALESFYVQYELNVFCATPVIMQKHYTELHKNILDVFNEYGVQIMTPAYEGDPEKPKVVPKDQTYAAPAKQKPSNGA